MLVKPAKFVLLDSSILGNLAYDYFSKDYSKHHSAKGFVESIGINGVIPFLCWHQFEELIKHKDDERARNRISFLKSLPHVAWIKASTDNPLGSIVDLLRAECKIILANPDFSVEQVRNATRESIIQFGSGLGALESYDDTWQALRPELWRMEEKARKIVAISRAKVNDISEEKLSTFLSGKFRDMDSAKVLLNEFRAKMAKEIEARGDRRITDPARVADNFYLEIEEELAAVTADNYATPETLLEQFNVSLKDFGPDARMKEVMALAEFRSKLKVAHKTFSLSWEKFKSAVSISQTPSWTVQNALFLHGQRRNEHKGSELNDRYLASFSPYCDLTYVDSQVKEDIRRALSKSSALPNIMNAVEKVTTIDRIREKLGGDF